MVAPLWFATAGAAARGPDSEEAVERVPGQPTSTYVRCWHRVSNTHDDPTSDWKWARNEDGSYLEIEGYWWSVVSFRNMFYTDVPQSHIQERCVETLGELHERSDVSFYAADHRLSFNHTIGSQGAATAEGRIDKIVSFGDSLSDTGNAFNGSQWRFPNRKTWFMGRFSNGRVWTEYVAEARGVPLYNWAVGGAAGNDQYGVIPGISSQVSSYLTYMERAVDYDPAHTLFTLEFGLNDFVSYDRDVTHVKVDYASALIRLTDHDARNLLLATLPDASRLPQFEFSTATSSGRHPPHHGRPPARGRSCPGHLAGWVRLRGGGRGLGG